MGRVGVCTFLYVCSCSFMFVLLTWHCSPLLLSPPSIECDKLGCVYVVVCVYPHVCVCVRVCVCACLTSSIHTQVVAACRVCACIFVVVWRGTMTFQTRCCAQNLFHGNVYLHVCYTSIVSPQFCSTCVRLNQFRPIICFRCVCVCVYVCSCVYVGACACGGKESVIYVA